MTPQELNASILQLAIQGKLVPQIPEEGTGEELYQQIQAEKQRLIKAGKIKKEKPLPEVAEDEIPFDIPENWCWVRLADLVDIYTGKKDANFGSPDGEYNFFTCSNQPIRCRSYSYDGEYLIMPGNGANIGMVIQHTGKFEAYQRTYLLENVYGIFLDYLKYHLEANWKQHNADKMYGSAIPYIKLGNLTNYCVAFPPLAEQKRIVAKIEELLPLIDRYEQAWSKLEEFNKRFPVDMQKSILQMAIQGKLVPQLPEEGTGEELYRKIQAEKQELIKAGTIKKEKPLPEIAEDEIPFDIPESWKWVRLNSLISLLSGSDLTPSKYNEAGKGIPYITGASNIEGDQLVINRWTEYPNNIAHKGDLLLTCKGTVGKTTILKETQVHIARQLMAITPLMIDIEYLKAFIESQVEGLKSKAKSMIPGIERDNVLELLIPLPPLDEQKRIVAKLEKILPLCERLK